MASKPEILGLLGVKIGLKPKIATEKGHSSPDISRPPIGTVRVGLTDFSLATLRTKIDFWFDTPKKPLFHCYSAGSQLKKRFFETRGAKKYEIRG